MTPERSTSWGELCRLFEEAVSRNRSWRHARLGLKMDANASSIAALAALEQLACDLFLLDGTLPDEKLQLLAKTCQFSSWMDPCDGQWTIHGASNEPESNSPASDSLNSAGSVTILTSGTTGGMKAVQHRWEKLTRPVRLTPDGWQQRWLLAFRPQLYAGLQVILQTLLNGGTLVAPRSQDDPEQIARFMARSRVTHASATPAYWRRLAIWATAESLQQVPLQQITLGGEPVDQELLNRLRDLFPSARIAHIYATTELGRCFSVTDGRCGFPASYLERATSDGIELQVRDNQLWVRSANAMVGYSARSTDAHLSQQDESGWFPTGDLVTIQGDRVLFTGRLSDIINVGGNKVHPLVVEQAIRELPEVQDVRVYAQTSSLAGQLVACKIVAQPSQDLDLLRSRILAHCRERLDRFQCPRVLEFVDKLELTAAGKLAR